MSKDKKTNKTWKQKLIPLAKFAANTAMIIAAAYGVRMALSKLEEVAAYAITIGFVLALAFIAYCIED